MYLHVFILHSIEVDDCKTDSVFEKYHISQSSSGLNESAILSSAETRWQERDSVHNIEM